MDLRLHCVEKAFLQTNWAKRSSQGQNFSRLEKVEDTLNHVLHRESNEPRGSNLIPFVLKLDKTLHSEKGTGIP